MENGIYRQRNVYNTCWCIPGESRNLACELPDSLYSISLVDTYFVFQIQYKRLAQRGFSQI